MNKPYDYGLSMISDIMFVETKNGNFQTTKKGVVFDDGNAFYIGGFLTFNGVSFEIISVPEVETIGSKSWIKVTFSVKKRVF